MSFQDLAGSIDREFIEDWLAKTGETLQTLPDTQDGQRIGSFVCQVAVMAVLQERGRIPSDQEKGLDFAMEFVKRLWPLFPLGARNDFGQQRCQNLEYLSWREPNAVSHNLFVSEARRNFRNALLDRFSEFPLLTEEDKDQILSVAPSIRSLGEYLTSAEQDFARHFGFSLLDEFQLVQFNYYLGDYPNPESESQGRYELFAGSDTPVFVELRDLSSDYDAVFRVHRTAFTQPPRSSHAEFINQNTSDGLGALWRRVENMAPTVNMSQEELRECFMKLTFMASYEAAHQLLMSDEFLDLASGRDSIDRDRSGFNFWYDLTLDYASKTATRYLLAVAGFYETVFPFFGATEIARVLVGNPLCIFLELIRLGSERSGTTFLDDRKQHLLKSEVEPSRFVATTEKHARESTQDERVVVVFISSTFRDMHPERNELIKWVFPQLRKLCEERGVTWSDIDLRWGITEEQSRRGGVLPVCFAEIRRCSYFLGILGERYGWVPDEIPHELIDEEPWLATHLSDSVTELEILHGVLNHAENANRALFYFRDPAYIDSLPPDEHPDYVELPTKEQIDRYGTLESKRLAEERQLKLMLLKQRIRASGARVRENYPNPKALGELALRDLTEIIVSHYQTAEIDPLDRETLDHESFARSRARVYISRPEYFDRLDEHAAGDGPPLVVLGESGSGKSALLSNWALRYRNSQSSMFVLTHFIGATRQSTDWAAMLRRIMAELKRNFDLDQEIPDQPLALRAAFMNCLHLAAAKGRIVLVLDALNQLEDRENCLDLPWLPLEIPANVRLLLSTLPGRPLIEIERRCWPTLDINPLTPPERLRLSSKYLANYAKRLNKDRRRRIATAEQSSNPLYLRALLDELRIFGIHDELDVRIAHYLTATNVSELYEKILERWEQDYEREQPGLVREAMSILWAARHGLSEAELLELLGTNGEPLPRAHWSPLYLAAEQSLVSRSGLLSFSHAHVREAVARLYLPTDAEREAAHLRLADYFEEQELYLHFEEHKLNRRKLNELPWQLAASKSWQRLGGLLAHPQFLVTAHKYDAFELKSYWTQVEAHSSLRMEETYRDIIENPQHHERHLQVIATLMTNVGRVKQGLRLWQYMTEHYRESGDQINFATMLQNQAMALQYLGNPDSALTFLTEAEQIWRQLRYKRGLQVTLGNIAAIRRSQSDFSGSMVALNEQEQICRELRALDGLVLCLDNKSLVLKDQGDLSGSMLLLEQAEQICRQLGDLDLLQANQLNKAALLVIQRELDSAMVLLNDIEPLSRQTNNFNVLQAVLNNKSAILRFRGDLDGAMRLAEEQEHICRTRNLPQGLATALPNRAKILRARRNLDEALRLFREAEQICRQLGNLNGVQICLGNQASVLEDQMDLAGALSLRNEQELISRKVGVPLQLTECLLGKAKLLAVPLGRGQEAEPLIEEAYQLAQNLGFRGLIEEIESLRGLVQFSRLYDRVPLTSDLPRKSVSPRLRPSGLASAAHPNADREGEAQRNIRYQNELACWKEELARWNALPFWKRFTIKKPEPPEEI